MNLKMIAMNFFLWHMKNEEDKKNFEVDENYDDDEEEAEFELEGELISALEELDIERIKKIKNYPGS